jgi:hypothetical protein
MEIYYYFHGGSSCRSGREAGSTPSTAVRGGNCRHDKDNDDNDAQTNVGVIPNGSGSGNDGNSALSLTQEAEDRRAEPQVTPREFGRLRRGGGPLTASRQ